MKKYRNLSDLILKFFVVINVYKLWDGNLSSFMVQAKSCPAYCPVHRGVTYPTTLTTGASNEITGTSTSLCPNG